MREQGREGHDRKKKRERKYAIIGRKESLNFRKKEELECWKKRKFAKREQKLEKKKREKV